MRKKAIFFAPNYYTSPYQSGSQHYARAFSRLGYDVLYISDPITPFHIFSRNKMHYQARLRIHRSGGLKDPDTGIKYYVPRSLIVPRKIPLLSSRWVASNWYRFSDVLHYIKEHSFDSVDIIWFDSSPFWFAIDYIEHRHSIMRIPDYIPGFGDVPPVSFEKDMELAAKVDLVVTTSSYLKEKLSEFIDPGKMLVVPNGLDMEKISRMDRSFPDEFKSIPEPRIIYIGLIRDWFDTELLYRTAISLQWAHFVLIGDVKTDISLLKPLKNIHFLGPKPYERIGQFLSHARVGIIPFKRNELVEYINPLKLYEYLAFGLPVVTTCWKEMENLRHLALVSRNHEEFANNIRKALTLGRVDIDVSQFDWKEKARTILKALHEKSNN